MPSADFVISGMAKDVIQHLRAFFETSEWGHWKPVIENRVETLGLVKHYTRGNWRRPIFGNAVFCDLVPIEITFAEWVERRGVRAVNPEPPMWPLIPCSLTISTRPVNSETQVRMEAYWHKSHYLRAQDTIAAAQTWLVGSSSARVALNYTFYAKECLEMELSSATHYLERIYGAVRQ